MDIERGEALDRFSQPMTWEYESNKVGQRSPFDDEEYDLDREIEMQRRLDFRMGAKMK